MLSFNATIADDCASFGAPQRDTYKQRLADALEGVLPEDIWLRVTCGSLRVEAFIVATTSTAAAQVKQQLETSALSTAAAASDTLQLSVVAVGDVSLVPILLLPATAPAPTPPQVATQPPASTAPPPTSTTTDEGASFFDGAFVGGAAGILVALCLCACVTVCVRAGRKRRIARERDARNMAGNDRRFSTVSVTIGHNGPPGHAPGLPPPPPGVPPGIEQGQPKLADKLKRMGSSAGRHSSFSKLPRDAYGDDPDL